MITITEYAELHGLARTWVHLMIKTKRLKATRKDIPTNAHRCLWLIHPDAKISPKK